MYLLVMVVGVVSICKFGSVHTSVLQFDYLCEKQQLKLQNTYLTSSVEHLPKTNCTKLAKH